jgi:hypothetical protein
MLAFMEQTIVEMLLLLMAGYFGRGLELSKESFLVRKIIPQHGAVR